MTENGTRRDWARGIMARREWENEEWRRKTEEHAASANIDSINRSSDEINVLITSLGFAHPVCNGTIISLRPECVNSRRRLGSIHSTRTTHKHLSRTPIGAHTRRVTRCVTTRRPTVRPSWTRFTLAFSAIVASFSRRQLSIKPPTTRCGPLISQFRWHWHWSYLRAIQRLSQHVYQSSASYRIVRSNSFE